MTDRYNIQWIGHCQYDTHNKVWGWFFYNDPTEAVKPRQNHCYTFWAGIGKTANFKKHHYWGSYDMDKLMNKKLSSGYKAISVDNLIEMWPTVYEDFDNTFIFNLLSDKFNLI